MGNIPIPWYQGVDYQYCQTLPVPWYQFCTKLGSISMRYIATKSLWLPQKIGQPGLKVEMLKLQMCFYNLITDVLDLVVVYAWTCPIIPWIQWYYNILCTTYHQVVFPILSNTTLNLAGLYELDYWKGLLDWIHLLPQIVTEFCMPRV